MKIPANNGPGQQEVARDALRIAADQYRRIQDLVQAEQNDRVLVTELARRNGITNQEIAEAYGVTEGAIRAMTRRATGQGRP